VRDFFTPLLHLSLSPTRTTAKYTTTSHRRILYSFLYLSIVVHMRV
jgi:hypothetical protein